MTPEQKQQRAVAAQQLLENQIFLDSFDIIRKNIYDSYDSISPKKTDEIQELTRTLQNLNRLEKTIKSTVSTGKVVTKHKSFLKKVI